MTFPMTFAPQPVAVEIRRVDESPKPECVRKANVAALPVNTNYVIGLIMAEAVTTSSVVSATRRRRRVIEMPARRPGDSGRWLRRIATPVEFTIDDPDSDYE